MSKAKPLPSASYLHECFSISPTGDLIWKSRPLSHFVDERIRKSFNTRRSGEISTSKRDNGYLVVCVNYIQYRAHRVVYVMNFGPIPDDMDIDHINGKRDDNRPCNLRLALRSENLHNSTGHFDSKTGVKGVTLNESGTYFAKLMFNGLKRSRTCKTVEEAEAWLDSQRKELHGEFANNGK
jgi:hypothetical protein